MRLDLGQQGHVSPSSIVELERQLADAFKATFAARQAAYDDEVGNPYQAQLLHRLLLCISIATLHIIAEEDLIEHMLTCACCMLDTATSDSHASLLCVVQSNAAQQDHEHESLATPSSLTSSAQTLGLSRRHSCILCQIRKLMAGRAQPDWDFSKFFLVKDSLAAMLESASLLEDALREYTEMEALFLTTSKTQPENPNSSAFGEQLWWKQSAEMPCTQRRCRQPMKGQILHELALLRL